MSSHSGQEPKSVNEGIVTSISSGTLSLQLEQIQPTLALELGDGLADGLWLGLGLAEGL
jgi:hypothetical protein